MNSSIDELKAKGYFEFKGRKNEQTLIQKTRRKKSKKSIKKDKRGKSHLKINEQKKEMSSTEDVDSVQSEELPFWQKKMNDFEKTPTVYDKYTF